MNELSVDHLFLEVAGLIRDARQTVSRAVNSAIVETYWQVGRLIVEDEQKGQAKAEYGKAVLDSLSKRLSAEFGKGFDARNLRYMRQFYICFPELCADSPIHHASGDELSIWNAVRSKLSWTHYRHLLKVENKEARTPQFITQ